MFLKLLDGKQIEIEDGKNGHDVALKISESLAKASIAYKLDGKLYDLYQEIPHAGEFELITSKSSEAFHILNHSTAHLMAEAIQSLFPEAKFGIGPAIEDGFYYDVDFADYVLKEEDLRKIESKMKEFSKKNEYIIRKVVSKDEALKEFSENPYKVELIKELEGEITTYSQGEFTDLCMGVHVPSTGFIKNFKLDTIAGAYWRGNSKNKQLTRIYGVSCFTKEELEHREHIKEEAKKRDHRKLGKELGLFMLSDFGPGLPFFLPNGYTLRRALEDFWLDYHKKNGYMVIETPIMLNRTLWEASGHWDHYHEDMYTLKVDEEDYAIKPMNCPGAILVYKNGLHSYKDLPLRYAELGHVHRHEKSGALNGLFRVRSFTQDDAHTLLREDQIGEEIKSIIKIYDHIYSLFGLDYAIELSTRPEDNFIGDIAVWDKAEEELKEACLATGKSFKINPGDGAFYGPKLDFKLKDCMGRIWQCGTVQLDMQLPGRFDCTYIDKDGEKKTPIMIHRACFGSEERFIGIITEHFAGAFPTWLAPVQVNVLPVNNEYHEEYAKEIKNKLMNLGFRCEMDNSEEKLGYRMRQSIIKKIPYTLVIGDKEKENGSVTYRRYSEEKQITVSLDEFVNLLANEVKEKKFLVDPSKI